MYTLLTFGQLPVVGSIETFLSCFDQHTVFHKTLIIYAAQHSLYCTHIFPPIQLLDYQERRQLF